MEGPGGPLARWFPVKRVAVFILLLYVLTYIVPLNARALAVPDEARYGEIAREMVASGDWIVPRVDGVRFFGKPPLGYWAIAASIEAFGENRFAIRLPMALSAGLTGVLVFLVARTVLGAGGGLLAAAVYLTFGQVFFIGIFCVLDSIFTLMLTASIAGFYFAHRATDGRRKRLLLAAAGAACGLAFLTKGFLALLLPGVVFGGFLLWQRGFVAFLKTIWLPLAVMLAVALPWSLAIHVREPGFWYQFFWVEHVNRAAGAPGLHPQPFWYYLPFLVAGLLPWTFLAGVPALGLRHTDLGPPGLRLCVLWAVLPFLMFSASSGKLGTYILPCFAPIAILWSAGLTEYFRRGRMRLWTFALRAIAVCTVIAGVGLVILQRVPAPAQPYPWYEIWNWVLSLPRPYEPSETWMWLIAVAAGAIWALATWRASTVRSLGAGVALFLSVPVLMMFVAPFSLPAIAQTKAPEPFLRQCLRYVDDNPVLIATPETVYAVCWIYKRTDVMVLGGIEPGMREPDGDTRGIRFPPEETSPTRATATSPRKPRERDRHKDSLPELRDFLARQSGRAVVIIGVPDQLAKAKDAILQALPASGVIDTDGRFVLYRIP